MKTVNYAGRLESKPLTKRERNAYIRNHFDIPALRKAGFLRPTERTFDEIEQRILTFFGLEDIREFSQPDEFFNGIIHFGDDEHAIVHYGRIYHD